MNVRELREEMQKLEAEGKGELPVFAVTGHDGFGEVDEAFVVERRGNEHEHVRLDAID